MADQDKPTNGHKPTNGERPIWSLSRDDQRLLCVTFLGGLGSIVVGAAIVGVAVALARNVFVGQARTDSVITLAVLWVFFFTAMFLAARQLRRTRERTGRVLLWVILVIAVLNVSIFGLTFIGLAIGVH